MSEAQAILQTPINTDNRTAMLWRWPSAAVAKFRASAHARKLRRLDERQLLDAGIQLPNGNHHMRIPVDGAVMRRLMSLR